MRKTVLMPVPSKEFDPSETAIPWKKLTETGIEVVIATPNGTEANADPIMLTGNGLGILKYTMRADHNALIAYGQMKGSGALQKTIPYKEINPERFDGLILPGGHAPGMKEYLDSEILHKLIGEFFVAEKPVGAICHGVVAAARSKYQGRSVLYGKKTTALPEWMEMLAWNLTKLWMGDYYRTYPMTVQEEVTNSLKNKDDFIRGPLGLKRDFESVKSLGFIVQDGKYLSARWPGDVHLFSSKFIDLLSCNL